MFTSLHIHNYKGIGPEPLEVDLAAVTVLVGRSGAGKSCVLEALALTAQSATEDPQRHDLVLSGSRLKLPTEGFQDYREPFKCIHYGCDPDRPLTVGFVWRCGHSTGETTALEYKWTRKGGRSPHLDHELASEGEPLLRLWTEVTSQTARGANKTTHVEIGGERIPSDIVQVGAVDRVLSQKLVDLVRPNQRRAENLDEEVSALVERAFARADQERIEFVRDELAAGLGGVHFLSSLRGASLMHSDPGPKVSFVGLHGENTIRLLSSIDARTKAGFPRLKEWGKKFGLGDVETGADGNQLKVVFVDPASGTSLELWQAATGSKQGLTMAAQLLLSPPGSTLLLEEPEANLHPGYEKLLPELFADSIRGGRQLLVTTHSEILIAALGNAVRKGLLAPEDVAIHHLERGKTGVKAVPVDVTSKGNLAGWVKSFASVEKELFNEWYDKLPQA